ncbi:CLIP-associating protein 1-B isoform X8 [Ciona intestinalis]
MEQDEALLLVREQDMKKRMNGGQQFIEFLSLNSGDLLWTNVDKIVDALATYWVSSSNFKVALLGLDILSLLVERLQDDFQQYYHLIQIALTDRMGDQKDQVRDASITLLTNIMDVASSPQYVFERFSSAFTHKVWRVREGVCRLLVATINRFGARSLYLSKLLPHVCVLLGDPNAQVREASVFTLVEIYRHVGEKVRQDIAKKNLPHARLSVLYKKFDEVLQSGNMVTASDTGSVASSTGSYDSVESSSSIGLMRPPMTSVVANNNNSRAVTNKMSSVTVKDGPSRQSTVPRKSTMSTLRPSTGVNRSNAGAVDEETFIRDFTSNLPTIHLYGSRDLDDQMNRIQAVISDEKKDWEERAKSLKALRAVALAGGTEYDAFYQHLRVMEPSLQFNAKDLRSQVVRETCVTVGCLSSILKNQFEHTACMLMPTLFNLIKNSAKVMSTSGVLTIKTILKHTHGPRLIPMLTINCTSKTTSLRRFSFIFLDIVLQNWTSQLLERHLAILKEAVQKGINDADSETREEARKAWWALQGTFPNEADQVFNNLNPGQQKLIKGHLATSSSSTDSQPKLDTRKPRSSVTSAGPRRSIVTSQVGRAPPTSVGRALGTPNGRFMRSRSDIDPSSANRSKMKAMRSGYGTLGPRIRNRHSPYGPQRVAKTSTSTISSLAPQRGRETDRSSVSQRSMSANRTVANRARSPGAQQPRTFGARTPSGPARVSKPRPSYTSRDHSPNGRSASHGGRTPSAVAQSPMMRVLPKGREGEIALNDALSRKTGRKTDGYGLSDNDDDFSDTSSVCSDRSSSYSRNGLKRHTNHTEDITEILQLCQSGLWTERKEGLFSLHTLITRHRVFNRLQIKKIIEIFNRMFADPHGKVFSMFLEMLPDFIQGYKEMLNDWLYFLLTQLLKKMGSDLLGSVQTKVLKALQVTRESFPPLMQFNILSRFIVDQTQRPNLKIKIALLHHMLDVTGMLKGIEISNTSDNRLAISRIITWTTEPKSQDVRKIAEALVISIFELNAPVFTMMIRVLPKTFQDGAMKVLHGYMKTNGDVNSVSSDLSGQVMGRAAMSPGRTVVSPRGSVGTIDLMSPRSSVHIDTENMNQEEIAENFRDITAGIQKLRMDSSADVNDAIKNSGQSPGLGASPNFSRPNFPPPLQQLQNSPKLPPGRQSKYNPHVYSDQLSPFNRGDVKESIFDEDDSFNEEIPTEMSDNISDVAQLLREGGDKRHALEELSRTLRSSDAVVGLIASQQQIQWDLHFNNVLSGVLEILRTDTDTRVAALNVLREMLRHLAHRFKNFTEITVIHIIESHKDGTKQVVRAAEEAANALCCAVPPILCVKVLSPLTRSNNNESTQACLKILTNAINRCSEDELDKPLVADLVPGLIKCYDNPESGVRKAAVFCLVALHRVIGDEELCQHLKSLPGGKMKLLQLYIKRSQSNAATEA